MTGFAWIRYMMMVLMIVVAVAAANTGSALAAPVAGEGTLSATGVGTVGLTGSGTVAIGPGAGTVWVAGAEDIQVEGRGRRTVLPDGTVRLTGYSGSITIVGEDMRVRIAGGAIGVEAYGKGSAVLQGEGSYTTGNGSGNWTRNGQVVQY